MCGYSLGFIVEFDKLNKGLNVIDLYNGDCLEIMDKLIEDGIKVDAIITDPPIDNPISFRYNS